MKDNLGSKRGVGFVMLLRVVMSMLVLGWLCRADAGTLVFEALPVGDTRLHVGQAAVVELVLRNEAKVSVEDVSFCIPTPALEVERTGEPPSPDALSSFLHGPYKVVPHVGKECVPYPSLACVNMRMRPGREWRGYVVLWPCVEPLRWFTKPGVVSVRFRLRVGSRTLLSRDVITYSISNPPDKAYTILRGLPEEERVFLWTALCRPFGKDAMKWMKEVFSARSNMPGLVERIMRGTNSEVLRYMARAALIKYNFAMLLREAQEKEMVGPAVRKLAWYKKVKELLGMNVGRECVPLIGREHELYRAHMFVLVGKMKDARPLLEDLARGDDYVAGIAASLLRERKGSVDKVKRLERK